MSAPHFFVWAGGVINLGCVVSAQVSEDGKQVHVMLMAGPPAPWLTTLTLSGEGVGEFMLHALRYHAGARQPAAQASDKGKT